MLETKPTKRRQLIVGVSNYYKKTSRRVQCGGAVERRQSVCLASQRISVQARGPSLFRCTLHS
ncbi:hypothetical protein TSAR_003859 [Trichomalopsis sarcophagae]|uniref:Uncharacterized protein n=1 Tax=Trichomalopsis sarcophagae TaxID=543379 RepID=A0A232EL44_9HYME|nr:hypothetical protein TSAR_003859 [Trichomalopsis sarcophagae]